LEEYGDKGPFVDMFHSISIILVFIKSNRAISVEAAHNINMARLRLLIAAERVRFSVILCRDVK